MAYLVHILCLAIALPLCLHFSDAKVAVKPAFLSVSTKRPNDGELEYAYMTKDRGIKDNEERVKTQSTQTGEDDETSMENGEQNDQNGETDENKNEEATENDKNGKKSMDDVPLATMQAPTSNIKNKTDSSSHRGDTSTFVTNNFYNPAEKEHDGLTAGAELQYEYLWKRIYDIDSKLLNLEPIHVDKTKDPLRRKGLTITFDAESDPDKHTVNIDDSVVA